MNGRRRTVPVTILGVVLLMLVFSTSAGAAPKHADSPHYNACSSKRHYDTNTTYTLPGDGSFKFDIYMSSWLDSGGAYCGVKQPVMHSYETEWEPLQSDESMSYSSIGLWIGGTNYATWTWSCPGYNNCIEKNNMWYGPDIHNLSCNSATYAYGEIDEAGGVSEFRPGQIYNSDYEGTAAASQTMNYC